VLLIEHGQPSRCPTLAGLARNRARPACGEKTIFYGTKLPLVVQQSQNAHIWYESRSSALFANSESPVRSPQPQLPIGLLTFATPPFIGEQVGVDVSLPMALDPLVACALTDDPCCEHMAPALLPSASAVALALQDASAVAVARAAPVAFAFALPVFSAKELALLPTPDEVDVALPPLSPSAVEPPPFFAVAVPLPPAVALASAELAPPIALAVAFPPFAVACAIPVPDCSAVALPAFSPWANALPPDAELSALPPSSPIDCASPTFDALAFALLGAPIAASQVACVPSMFEDVTSELVVEHDSWSEAANAPVPTVIPSATAATAALI
jgi:hypothetical protein